MIEDLTAANTKREAENKIIADQVTELKEIMPKALEGWKANGDAKLEELGQEVQSLKKLLENRLGRSSGASPSTGRGYHPNAMEKPKDNISTSNSANNKETTIPGIESAGGPSSPTPAGTMSKRESVPSRPFERGDRRAIPAWQMAAATTEKTESASSSPNAEASKAEAVT